MRCGWPRLGIGLWCPIVSSELEILSEKVVDNADVVTDLHGLAAMILISLPAGSRAGSTIAPADNLLVEGMPKIPRVAGGNGGQVTVPTAPRSCGLAPGAARNADGHAVRRHAAIAPSKNAGRRTATTYVFPDSVTTARFHPEWRRLHFVHERYWRRRVVSAVPLRPGQRQRDAADRREIAKHTWAHGPRAVIRLLMFRRGGPGRTPICGR